MPREIKGDVVVADFICVVPLAVAVVAFFQFFYLS